MCASGRVIKAIHEAGGDGIEFICTLHRVKSPEPCKGSGGTAIAQLAMMVRALCSLVAKLTERFDQLCASPCPSFPLV